MRIWSRHPLKSDGNTSPLSVKATQRPEALTLQIDVLRPRDLSAEDIARWVEIQGMDPALDSPFLSPFWAQTVERAQGDSRHAFKVAILRDGQKARGFFPVRAGRLTALPVGAPFNDAQAVIAEPGLDVDPLALVSALGVKRYDFTLQIESQRAFAPFARGRCEIRLAEMPDGYAAYEAEKRAGGEKLFKRMATNRRRAEREFGEIRFEALSSSKAAFEVLMEAKSRQLRGAGQTDIFGPAWPRRMLEDLLARRTADFGAVLFTLHLGGNLAAVHLHLHTRRTLNAWLITHDPHFSQVSPGILLFLEVLKWMDGAGLHRMGLGIGDYQFKRDLGTASHWVTHGTVGLPSPVTWLREAAYAASALAEALPLGKFSDYPARARRRIDVIRSLR